MDSKSETFVIPKKKRIVSSNSIKVGPDKMEGQLRPPTTEEKKSISGSLGSSLLERKLRKYFKIENIQMVENHILAEKFNNFKMLCGLNKNEETFGYILVGSNEEIMKVVHSGLAADTSFLSDIESNQHGVTVYKYIDQVTPAPFFANLKLRILCFRTLRGNSKVVSHDSDYLKASTNFDSHIVCSTESNSPTVLEKFQNSAVIHFEFGANGTALNAPSGLLPYAVFDLVPDYGAKKLTMRSPSRLQPSITLIKRGRFTPSVGLFAGSCLKFSVPESHETIPKIMNLSSIHIQENMYEWKSILKLPMFAALLKQRYWGKLLKENEIQIEVDEQTKYHLSYWAVLIDRPKFPEIIAELQSKHLGLIGYCINTTLLLIPSGQLTSLVGLPCTDVPMFHCIAMNSECSAFGMLPNVFVAKKFEQRIFSDVCKDHLSHESFKIRRERPNPLESPGFRKKSKSLQWADDNGKALAVYREIPSRECLGMMELAKDLKLSDTHFVSSTHYPSFAADSTESHTAQKDALSGNTGTSISYALYMDKYKARMEVGEGFTPKPSNSKDVNKNQVPGSWMPNFSGKQTEDANMEISEDENFVVPCDKDRDEMDLSVQTTNNKIEDENLAQSQECAVVECKQQVYDDILRASLNIELCIDAGIVNYENTPAHSTMYGCEERNIADKSLSLPPPPVPEELYYAPGEAYGGFCPSLGVSPVIPSIVSEVTLSPFSAGSANLRESTVRTIHNDGPKNNSNPLFILVDPDILFGKFKQDDLTMMLRRLAIDEVLQKLKHELHLHSFVLDEIWKKILHVGTPREEKQCLMEYLMAWKKYETQSPVVKMDPHRCDSGRQNCTSQVKIDCLQNSFATFRGRNPNSRIIFLTDLEECAVREKFNDDRSIRMLAGATDAKWTVISRTQKNLHMLIKAKILSCESYYQSMDSKMESFLIPKKKRIVSSNWIKVGPVKKSGQLRPPTTGEEKSISGSLESSLSERKLRKYFKIENIQMVENQYLSDKFNEFKSSLLIFNQNSETFGYIQIDSDADLTKIVNCGLSADNSFLNDIETNQHGVTVYKYIDQVTPAPFFANFKLRILCFRTLRGNSKEVNLDSDYLKASTNFDSHIVCSTDSPSLTPLEKFRSSAIIHFEHEANGKPVSTPSGLLPYAVFDLVPNYGTKKLTQRSPGRLRSVLTLTSRVSVTPSTGLFAGNRVKFSAHRTHEKAPSMMNLTSIHIQEKMCEWKHLLKLPVFAALLKEKYWKNPLTEGGMQIEVNEKAKYHILYWAVYVDGPEFPEIISGLQSKHMGLVGSCTNTTLFLIPSGQLASLLGLPCTDVPMLHCIAVNPECSAFGILPNVFAVKEIEKNLSYGICKDPSFHVISKRILERTNTQETDPNPTIESQDHVQNSGVSTNKTILRLFSTKLGRKSKSIRWADANGNALAVYREIPSRECLGLMNEPKDLKLSDTHFVSSNHHPSLVATSSQSHTVQIDSIRSNTGTCIPYDLYQEQYKARRSQVASADRTNPKTAVCSSIPSGNWMPNLSGGNQMQVEDVNMDISDDEDIVDPFDKDYDVILAQSMETKNHNTEDKDKLLSASQESTVDEVKKDVSQNIATRALNQDALRCSSSEESLVGIMPLSNNNEVTLSNQYCGSKQLQNELPVDVSYSSILDKEFSYQTEDYMSGGACYTEDPITRSIVNYLNTPAPLQIYNGCEARGNVKTKRSLLPTPLPKELYAPEKAFEGFCPPPPPSPPYLLMASEVPRRCEARGNVKTKRSLLPTPLPKELYAPEKAFEGFCPPPAPPPPYLLMASEVPRPLRRAESATMFESTVPKLGKNKEKNDAKPLSILLDPEILFGRLKPEALHMMLRRLAIDSKLQLSHKLYLHSFVLSKICQKIFHLGTQHEERQCMIEYLKMWKAYEAYGLVVKMEPHGCDSMRHNCLAQDKLDCLEESIAAFRKMDPSSRIVYLTHLRDCAVREKFKHDRSIRFVDYNSWIEMFDR